MQHRGQTLQLALLDQNFGSKLHKVDCWVYVEELASSLDACLRRFESQGGTVQWDALRVEESLMQATATNDSVFRTTGGKSGADMGAMHHGHCSRYFNLSEAAGAAAAASLERDAGALYRTFGYAGCCSKDLTRVTGSMRLLESTRDHHAAPSSAREKSHEKQYRKARAQTLAQIRMYGDNQTRLDPKRDFNNSLLGNRHRLEAGCTHS